MIKMKVKLGIGFGTKDKQNDRQQTKKAKQHSFTYQLTCSAKSPHPKAVQALFPGLLLL